MKETHRNRTFPPPGTLTVAVGTEVRKEKRVTMFASPLIDPVKAGGGERGIWPPEGQKRSLQSSAGLSSGDLTQGLQVRPCGPGMQWGLSRGERWVAFWLQIERPGWLGRWPCSCVHMAHMCLSLAKGRGSLGALMLPFGRMKRKSHGQELGSCALLLQGFTPTTKMTFRAR